MKITGICGSLRQGSYNHALLRAAAAAAPAGVTLTLAPAVDLPIYSPEREAAPPDPAVAALREAVAAAQAVIIATPEYNYSIPGGLKNALDWLSRPENDKPTRGKPVAIIGASTSLTGTARAQMHLRQVVYYHGMHLFSQAEILVPRAQERFAADGTLTDAGTRERVEGFMAAFVAFARKNVLF